MAGPSRTNLGKRQFAQGALCAAGAVAIWAGWVVVMRLGVTTTLSAMDIAAIRFAVAGLLLLPVVVRRGFALDRLGAIGFAALVLGGGVPFVLTVGAGLLVAPAAHAGAFVHGVLPFVTAAFAWAVLEEPMSRARLLGLALMLPGLAAIAGSSVLTSGGGESIGHVLFVCAAALWACYTVAARRAGLDGLHAAAIVSVVSLVVYLPIYVFFIPSGLADAPATEILFQAFYQGILTMIVSLALYGRAIQLLGASGAAAFGALGPAMAALIGIPVLGEIPLPIVWGGILIICAGVYLGGGGPLPGRRRESTRPTL